jgi:hypothetical protein
MEERTNVGSMKIIGEGTERPGIGSNHTPTIHSLHNPVQNNIHANESKGLLKRMLTNLAKSNPCEPDQTKEEQDPHAKGYVSVYVGPLHYLCSQFGLRLYTYIVTTSTWNSAAFQGVPQISFSIPEPSIVTKIPWALHLS